MELDHFWAFLAFSYVCSATPGPNNLMLTAIGGRHGIRQGIPALLGIAIGFAVMIFILSLGVGGLSDSNSFLGIGMRTGGALLLVWMSWKIASAPVDTASEESHSEDKPAMGFMAAALFQWINPKAWLICAGAIATYFDSHHSMLTQSLIFGSAFILSTFLGSTPWLTLGGILKTKLSNPKFARVFNISMGGLLLLSTIPAVIMD